MDYDERENVNNPLLRAFPEPPSSWLFQGRDCFTSASGGADGKGLSRETLDLLIRRIHKWIGLVIGLQCMIRTASGAIMALIYLASSLSRFIRPKAQSRGTVRKMGAAWLSPRPHASSSLALP